MDKTVPKLFQPDCRDFYDGIVYANNNIGSIYRIEFPNGYIEFKINEVVLPEAAPLLPPLPGTVIPNT